MTVNPSKPKTRENTIETHTHTHTHTHTEIPLKEKSACVEQAKITKRTNKLSSV